ncbi:hypothetical protein D3C72_1210420 [compost metagenome]
MKNAFEYEAELAALREDLADSEEELDTVIHHNIDLQQRLADAERREVDMVRLLTRARIYARGEFRDEIDACLVGKTALVAVVLPERECEDCFQNDQSEQAIGFNRAIDKVKELNQ